MLWCSRAMPPSARRSSTSTSSAWAWPGGNPTQWRGAAWAVIVTHSCSRPPTLASTAPSAVASAARKACCWAASKLKTSALPAGAWAWSASSATWASRPSPSKARPRVDTLTSRLAGTGAKRSSGCMPVCSHALMRASSAASSGPLGKVLCSATRARASTWHCDLARRCGRGMARASAPCTLRKASQPWANASGGASASGRCTKAPSTASMAGLDCPGLTPNNTCAPLASPRLVPRTCATGAASANARSTPAGPPSRRCSEQAAPISSSFC